MNSLGLVTWFLLTPPIVAVVVVRYAQRRARVAGVAPRDAARRYSRALLLPWIAYALNILGAARLVGSSSSELAVLAHTPLGAALFAGVGLLPVLFIALVVRVWARSLGHPAGAIRASVEVRAWMVQALFAVGLLACAFGLLVYVGPVASIGGALALATLELLLFQDVFRWIWRTRPLPDRDQERLQALLRRTGASVQRILVIPAASSGTNAFVSGMLERRRYLFVAEHLLTDLPPDEVDAVIAHEIGHLVHRHVARVGIAAVATSAVAALVFMGTVAITVGGASDEVRRPWFALAGAGTALATLAITRRLLRKFEFEADEFAARTLGSPQPMANALRTLARVNWLAEDGLDAGAFASHPTIRRRIERLSGLAIELT